MKIDFREGVHRRCQTGSYHILASGEEYYQEAMYGLQADGVERGGLCVHAFVQ